MKKNLLIAFFFALWGIGCESDDTPVEMDVEPVSVDQFKLGQVSLDSLDDENHEIFVTSKKGFSDSIVFKDVGKILEITGGKAVYRATSDDEYDPDIVDWETPLKDGIAVSFNGSDTLKIVVLDSTNCVTDIWKILLSGRPSSSSTKVLSSSSKKVSSSSKKDMDKSSSSVKDSGSSASEKGKDSSSSRKGDSASSKESSSESFTDLSSNSVNGLSSSSANTASSSDKKSSSSEEEPSSSEENSSSSEEVEDSSSSEAVPPELSSEKEIATFQIWVSGTRFTDADLKRNLKTISLKLPTVTAVDSVQMYRLTLSEGASATVPLKSNLVLTKAGDYTYEYAFTVSAEDGSSEGWKIVATIPKGVNVKDFAVDVEDSRVTINGTKIYVELPYDSTLDLTALKVLPMDTNANLLRPLKMNFVDENDELQTYEVVAGMQLPGTNFKSLNLDFWGTTSNAMGVAATVADINVSSEENLSVTESGVTMTSKILTGKEALTGIKGSEKLGGGFYFTGSYGGTGALSLYDRTNSGSTPSLGSSDASKDMTFGRPFKCRPESFTVKYSYAHVTNSNKTYPQKYLIYVLLVSEDNYVVASGLVTGRSSVTSESTDVSLAYGDDSGILSAGFPVASSFAGVDGTKDVASIHVMFASSAYAHVVAGGTTWFNDPTDDFRGGEGASLTIESFRLNY